MNDKLEEGRLCSESTLKELNFYVIWTGRGEIEGLQVFIDQGLRWGWPYKGRPALVVGGQDTTELRSPLKVLGGN